MRRTAKAETSTLKEQSKREAEAQKMRRIADDAMRFGHRVLKTSISGQKVELFENGFVKVSLFGKSDGVERLVAVTEDAQVSKKSAVGRTAGFVVTGGLNMLTPNKRGDLYVTIVTDRRTHVLHQDTPTSMRIKAAKNLVGVAHRLIAAHDTQHAESGHGTVADRLRDLESLYRDRLLTEDEYHEKRTQLVKEL